MSNGYYDFIAKKINSFFQTAASEGTLLRGESFYQKFDDDEMVRSVFYALKHFAEENQIIGEYELVCKDGSIYKTYTLKVQEDEVIIAAQIDGMTNDFLCATLRNAANDAQKLLLMISSNPIDSAKSGSRDLSAKGMPFHADQLMEEIREKANKSTLLTNVEKRILQFELKRRDSDVFCDKTSIYEYRDLLSIISSGKIDTDNYQGFRLFSIDGKAEYINENAFQIDKAIKENNALYEKIDRALRFGTLESDMAMIFDNKIVEEIGKEYKKDPDNWSKVFSYNRLLAAKEQKQFKMENPLKIENENIVIYGDLPEHTFSAEENVIIRNEGSQTARKRNKNILIFNPDQYASIHLRITCNTVIPNSGIAFDDAVYTKKGKNIVFEFQRKDLSFHKIQLEDRSNGIAYIFKIAIIDIPSEYMFSTVKHCFTIDYKSKKSNCCIKLAGIGTDLIFNKSASQINSCKLEENETYNCKYGERLHVYTSEEELLGLGSKIKINVNFAGITVPFILHPDEPKNQEIIGRKILKEKLSAKESFTFENNSIQTKAQEYFAKTNLLRELRLEQDIISRKVFTGRIKDFHIPDQVVLEEKELEVPNELRNAYIELLKAFEDKKTIPTLAYLGKDLKKYVAAYIKAFSDCFAFLKDGENLSLEQENALQIGTLEVGKNAEEILLTPFHPLNLAYQLSLLNETGMEDVSDLVVSRLNSVNLLPYIQRNRKIYKVSDQLYSQEWRYYAPVENKKYRGGRRYVAKLVEEKISEFVSHFKYIFDDINNKTIRINLINMGDCSEVFLGLAQFFIHSVNRNADTDKLIQFELHIYTDHALNNVFSNVKEYAVLKNYLAEQKLFIEKGISMNTLEGIISKNVSCYFHKDNGKSYEYAHVTFYEMESETTSEQATMNQIETGISLGGILSGIPSSKYGHKYRTGYGCKYAEETPVVKLASKYNALMQVEATGNPYHEGTSISTQIDKAAEQKMEYIYKSSNWVVFVEPKVDLDFFIEKEANSDLLIIHYSDQRTSSSGYDAITVTNKSEQYSMVIQEYLKGKSVKADAKDAHNIINLFNAVNGEWLLRLVSSKKGTKDSTFSREKISIVAAIKLMLAFLKHEDLVWVPISLEEMLRVSGGTGLSQKDGMLSAQNLGFEKGPTSDDLLFIGVDKSGEQPKIYLYPTEVKTGNNEATVIKKAFKQVSATAEGLHSAFNPDRDLVNTILYKVNRNFLMQLLVTSCKKMQVYHVDDSQDWNLILDRYREAILNEKYVLSENIQELIGKGAVLSFRKGLIERKTSFKENAINFIEVPENDEFDLILKTVSEIYTDIRGDSDNNFFLVDSCTISNLTGDLTKIQISDLEITDETVEAESEETQNNSEKVQEEQESDCIQVLFGNSDQDGSPIVWRPNDTSQLFHTNTGIIGTMGTGKTQFTKSLITQLYREQGKNVDGHPLGILIFDYKGDYNETKADFVKATNASIYKPYHLPFNPLALTKSSVFKPLLPTHTANAFKDTLSKAFNLGPKQQHTLFQCIMETYSAYGINPSDPTTWDNPAPTLFQVYQRYMNDEDIKKGDSLSAALDKLIMFEVFEGNPDNTKTLFDVLNGVVVIDLSSYDEDIQSLVIAITLDLFYSQMQAAGSSKMQGNYRQLTKMILVDEADNFMKEEFPSLKKILKEGREFGVGTILSTQFLKHFGGGDDDYAKYILTWVVHNVSDLKSTDIDFVFKTETKSQETQALFKAIKTLEKHHSIVKMGNHRPIYMRDKAFWELYQQNPY